MERDADNPTALNTMLEVKGYVPYSEEGRLNGLDFRNKGKVVRELYSSFVHILLARPQCIFSGSSPLLAWGLLLRIPIIIMRHLSGSWFETEDHDVSAPWCVTPIWPCVVQGPEMMDRSTASLERTGHGFRGVYTIDLQAVDSWVVIDGMVWQDI